ncbi:MAG TPA: DUF429 domain-containing protein [Dehalococcoidia bacterium]|nr:DUF429 domain-containing protein [Dehalococcoidia bacterium]
MYLGIDLAFPGKPVACALLDKDASFQFAHYVDSDEAILELASSCRPGLVAIDAPLALPAGWSCLDDPCHCGACPDDPGGRRSAETALSARGISTYWTTRRSFIRPMVLRGIALKAALLAMGPDVIEIYPYASKRLLFGPVLPNKRRRAGRRFLQERLAALLPGLPEEPLLSHDLLDALLAAYTGWLYGQGRTENVGAEDGAIVIPLALG